MAQRHKVRGYSTRENPNHKCLGHIGILRSIEGNILSVVQAKRPTILSILRQIARNLDGAQGPALSIQILKGNWRKPTASWTRTVHRETVSA